METQKPKRHQKCISHSLQKKRQKVKSWSNPSGEKKHLFESFSWPQKHERESKIEKERERESKKYPVFVMCRVFQNTDLQSDWCKKIKGIFFLLLLLLSTQTQKLLFWSSMDVARTRDRSINVQIPKASKAQKGKERKFREREREREKIIAGKGENWRRETRARNERDNKLYNS